MNANGDSCDVFNNIYDNPLMVNPSAGNYHLQEGSPCIDAGDPASPLDPDGTVADIGAIHFPQAGPPLVLTLTPGNPPVIIPGGGGIFGFSASIENNTQDPFTFDAWTEVILPNGAFYPLILRRNLVIPAGGTISRQLSQSVPGIAPPGNYSYVGKVGVHPDSALSRDEFPFIKLPGEGAASRVFNWNCLGWEIEGQSILEPESGLVELSGFPNPFNAETVARLELRVASRVKLAVYDISGREVVQLGEGIYPTGTHQFVWDASSVSSGVYFARLKAGEIQRAVKLLLVK